MKVTYTWLKEYVPLTVSVEEAASALTNQGIEVEGITPLHRDFSRVVVGEVRAIEPLDGSSSLKRCLVSIGRETLVVVCGAPNVAPGLQVAVALPGAVLANGTVIGPREFGGVTSQAMLCSELELGISERGEFIMTLADNAKVGESLSALVPAEDYVLELNVTPNRPDCLSVIGVARELAARFGHVLTRPSVSLPTADLSTQERVEVAVKDLQGCPRYSARFLYDVKVGPSPWWLASRLYAVGLRSINNIVDVTNYVMLETGQPLHAFDYDLIEEERIEVRQAVEGEEFTTLDGKSHLLREGMLLICDGVRPVAIAGVMGGLNSEVSASTSRVLLESAYFAPQSIRRTSKALGISTESSQRFERGVDPNGVLFASERAAQLMVTLCDGKVAQGVVDVYPSPIAPKQINLRPQRVGHVLGADIPTKDCVRILTALGAEVEERNDVLSVRVPTFRPDLEREVDLIEEVARVWGYDRIPARTVSTIEQARPQMFQDLLEERARQCLIGLGFFEACTISLLDSTRVAAFAREGDLVRLKNPLSEEYSSLRPSLIPGLLQVCAYNVNRGAATVRVFEMGRCFSKTGEGYQEWKALGVVLTGLVRPRNWSAEHREVTLFDAKGLVEALCAFWRVPAPKFAPGNWRVCKQGGLQVLVDGRPVVRFGQVTQEVLDHFDIERRQVFAIEVLLELVREYALRPAVYRPVPRFPHAPRDLSVVVDQRVHVEELLQAIRTFGGRILRDVQVVDLFLGKQIPPGKKSLTFSLTFQEEDRTLRDEEVDEAMDRIVNGLREKTGAVLRS
ncbi:MAG: phenylalanine--tRNA ligase subunit beta [candidate division KSB1 bacterium]|nr:phenylalanine--tRNA ligase subunit beta [candidate division KSB1 bacterium]